MKAPRKRLQLEKLFHSVGENSLEVSGFVLEIFNSYWKLLVHTVPQQEKQAISTDCFCNCYFDNLYFADFTSPLNASQIMIFGFSFDKMDCHLRPRVLDGSRQVRKSDEMVLCPPAIVVFVFVFKSRLYLCL